MITLRKSEDRGSADHGWLKTHHSFSFAGYHDPAHMGFRSLRVLNDDRIAPRAGFPMHAHRDMEIVSYVAQGALAHRDSKGNSAVVRPGDLQRMTAGSGVQHSEYNASDDWTRLLQIWILPRARGREPGYEQRHFDESERRGRLRLVGSPDGRDGSLTIDQDVSIYAGLFGPGDTFTHELAPGRHAWVQVVRGTVRLGDHELREGDGARVSDERTLELASVDDAELLLFDLA